MNTGTRTALRIAALVLALAAGSCLAAPAEEDAIRQSLAHTWHSDTTPLLVGPLVVEGNHAIADWQQGERGGRALLTRSENGWQVTLCAGDGLKTVALLVEAGVPPAQAGNLAAALARAEATLDAATLARMTSFEGPAHHR